ncbi:hypothetical protein F183_A47830 [Bryobacterales bacterium F-183]|nr:hypothetical protein F183_A47830 [Bryobacterales bacterium F-183]
MERLTPESHENGPQAIFRTVFCELRPRSPIPPIAIEFCRFANANAFIQLKQGRIEVRITDVLQNAPEDVLEALAYILLSKLYRRPVPRESSHRYRRYLLRKDVRERISHVRRERGRKEVAAAAGGTYDLDEIFDAVNARYFHGLMARPSLGWSIRASRQTLGHYDASHHTIVLSRILDSADVPRLAVEYVMYHEMLHIRFPTEHRGARRCVHTREFKTEERKFEGFDEAKAILKAL